MYRYYRKEGYNVMEYDFDSITEFINYIDNTPTNRDVWGRRELASQTGDYDFCKTRSLEEAKELCKLGNHDRFEKLVE